MTIAKRHCQPLIEILQNDKMIDIFYTDLFDKIEKNDICVRDIINRTHHIPLDSTIYEKRIEYNKYLISLLIQHPHRAIAKISKIHLFNEMDIENMLPECYSNYDSFLVIGCPDSTDIDVIVFVRSIDQKNGQIKELSYSATRRLYKQLEEIGYDTNRSVDINCVYVNPVTKMIIASTKGGSETQNIINATWMYHEQVIGIRFPHAIELHPVVNIKYQRQEIFDKLRALAKYILDYGIDISHNYLILSQIKKELYSQSGDCMMKFMKNIPSYIEVDPINILAHNLIPLAKWHDRFKSIIMKLLQIIYLFRIHKDDDIEDSIYVKNELAKCIRIIFKDELDHATLQEFEDCALWFLYRGSRGMFSSKLFPYLLKTYCVIIDHFLSQSDPMIQRFTFDQVMDKLDQENNTIPKCMVNSTLMSNFFKSPIEHTKEFEDEWCKLYGLENINSQFPIKSSSKEDFFSTYSKLDKKVLDVFDRCLIFMDQRSPEWLHCLEHKFVCGNNSAVISDSFKAKYNLIRGAIMEQLATLLFDQSTLIKGVNDVDYDGGGAAAGDVDKKAKNTLEKWTVGFIVEENVEGVRGFAPDLILISDNVVPEFILVEIKGLKCSNRNADYYRGLHLASKQIGSGKTILSKYLSTNGCNIDLEISRGIIILCFIEDNVFNMEILEVKL
jgi:hypothetical protein